MLLDVQGSLTWRATIICGLHWYVTHSTMRNPAIQMQGKTAETDMAVCVSKFIKDPVLQLTQ